MELPLLIEKISGKGDETIHAGVFSKRVTLGDGTVGTVAICLLLEGTGDKPTATHDIFEIFCKKLEDSGSGFLFSLKLASATASNVGGEELKVSFTTCFFYKDICYIVRVGEVVRLFVFGGGEPVEINFESGSGHASGGQVYLLATQELLSFFDPAPLSIAGVDLAEVLDGLATEITHREDQAKIGAVMIAVGEMEEEEFIREVAPLPDVETEVREQPVEQTAVSELEQNAFLARIKAGLRGFIGSQIATSTKLRRNIFLVAIVVVLFLVASVGFALFQSSKKQGDSQFNQHFGVAQIKYTEATALISLNKTRAREILVEADLEVKEALKIKPKSAEALQLARDIEARVYDTDITTNVSLSELATVEGQLNSLLVNGKNFIGVSGNKVYQLNSTGEVSSDIDVVSAVTSGFVYDNKAFLLANGGVIRVDLASEKSEEVIEAAGFDIAMFFGNVYILKSDGILKAVPIEGGYSQPTDYLEAKVSFDTDSRMAIDSLIWATAGDKILKFNRGKQESFEISGLAAKLGRLGPIYTDSKLSNVYVVDRLNSAIVVVDKDGVYKKTLNASEFATASDLVVNEAEDTLYVVVGPKILKATL